MSINPVGYNQATFKAAGAQQNNQPAKLTFADKIEKNNEKVLKYPPIATGLINAVGWTVVGMGADKLTSKIFGLKQNSIKSSLIINGLLGSIMGIYSYNQAKKLQAKDAATPKT